MRDSGIDQMLQQAMRLHQPGRLAKAEAPSSRVIAGEPDQALHLLGRLKRQPLTFTPPHPWQRRCTTTSSRGSRQGVG
jgi:hypothetical protein